jgi:ATP-dependent helicase/DNAse subunit B
MPLTLVLGPANSAKAGEVLGAYAALVPRGALLVVPTALDARHYRRELADDGVVFGSVVTFSGLAREIARRSGYSASPLSDLQREEVIRRVLGGLELQAVGESARAPGFRRAAGELIAELERELVTPQRFVSALRSWAAEDGRRDAYAADLGTIYQGYARELEQIGRVDRELFAWRALDGLRSEPGRWGRDEVFFYGFDDLTALERDAVETLARIAGAGVTVSLTYEAGRAALAARAEAVQELSPLAERVIELPAVDDYYQPASRVALHHLERRLFEPATDRIDPGSAVTLLESGGERAEAELVAGQVLALLHQGVPGGQIAVVHRSMGYVAPLFHSVFAEYGIATAGRRDALFAHTPLGRGVLGAARCALADPGDARARDLLAYLRAPGLLDQPEIADGLEAEILREGLITAADARERLGWELRELDALRASDDPGSTIAQLARRLFAAPRRGLAATLSQGEELDARALARLLEALAEVGQLGWRPRGPELIELLEELTFRTGGPGGPDDVLLAEPLEIRARRFRAVFVCGLQEGAFPVPAGPEPFLSDERRWELAASSGLRLRPHDDVLGRERYLFYSALSRATEWAVLSYRSSDEEGNLALPSPFIADVAELFVAEWPEHRARRLLADVVWPSALAPTERELDRSLAATRAPAVGDEPEPERLLGAVALNRVRHSEILSAGALETYADCPVKWLIEKELEPEALEPEGEPLVRGSLIHEILEALLTELDGPVSESSLQRAHEILGRLLSQVGAEARAKFGAGRPEIVRAGALRAIEADLRRYLDHEAREAGPWRPAGLELRFGFEDDRPSLPALELSLGDERVRFRGLIDRLDVDGSGHAMIRDYKSGASRVAWRVSRWREDRQLQVALYMIVVRELTELEPVAGFYQPLRGKDLRPRGMFREGAEPIPGAMSNDRKSPEEFTDELDNASARAIALTAALRAGVLTPCPQTCSRDGCAHPGICRSQ